MSDTLAGRHVLSGDEPERSGLPLYADEQPTQALDALAPPLAVATPTNAPDEQVTCPECGTVAVVALTRRESEDFCRTCDFPLFWTPSKIVLDAGTTAGDSLRRLPGTSGRVTVGSIECPTCAEGNVVTAEVCLRCGGPMVLPPAPVVVAAPPPPPPAPEPAPERTPLWVWILGGSTLLLLLALVLSFVTR